jgi:hypothetical protein
MRSFTPSRAPPPSLRPVSLMMWKRNGVFTTR